MCLFLDAVLVNERFPLSLNDGETAKCTISTYYHCSLLTDFSPHHERLIQISSFSHSGNICNSLPNAILPFSFDYLSCSFAVCTFIYTLKIV